MKIGDCLSVAGVTVVLRDEGTGELLSVEPAYHSFLECADLPDVELLRGPVASAPVFVGDTVFRGGLWDVTRCGDLWRTRFNENESGELHILDRMPDGRWALWSGEQGGDLSGFYKICSRMFWSWLLAERGGFISHSVSAVMGGSGFLALGSSGAGKSTFALLAEQVEAGSVLCDDRSAICVDGEGFLLYGTPWSSSAEIGRNRNAPLHAMFVLKQAPENGIKPLSPIQAAEQLLSASTVLWYVPHLRDKVLAAIDKVVSRIPCFELSFIPDASAVDTVRRQLDALGCVRK